MSGQRVTGATSRRRVPRLVPEADNQAASLWRQRKPCTDVVKLAAELVTVDDTYEQLAHHHGTFITCLRQRENGTAVEFGIWGTKEDVMSAKNAILRWSLSNGRNAGEKGFSKLASMTQADARQKQKEFKTKVRQCRYRQHPPVDMGFEAIGSFHWPVDDYRPDETFGQNFEALDPIRMDCSCYISFLPERAAFQICGKITDVEQAIRRIRMTYFQIVARSLASVCVRAYLLHWCSSSDIPSQVYLQEYCHTAVLSPSEAKHVASSSKSPRACKLPMALIKFDEAQKKSQVSITHVQQSIQQLLRKLHYYRGDLELRVRFGTFLLDQYEAAEGDRYTLDHFESMINRSQFIGSVTDEIGECHIERSFLSILKSRHDILEPADPLVKTLHDVSPTYSAVFTFADPAGNIVMEVQWRPVKDMYGNMQYELGQAKFTRLDRDTGKYDKLYDASLVNLHHGTAWQFEIIASDVINTNKVPILLQEFASSLKLVFPDSRAGGQREPTIKLPKFLRPMKYRQLKTYQFVIQETDYVLDLAHFQDFELDSNVSRQQPMNTTRYEARWALSVSRTFWRNQFSENALLPIGGRAEWDDDIGLWFRETAGMKGGNGFEELICKLSDITEAVYSDEEGGDDVVEIFQGMRVG